VASSMRVGVIFLRQMARVATARKKLNSQNPWSDNLAILTNDLSK
jgi:hypothetical protein